MTRADIRLVFRVYNARRFGCGRARYPTLERIAAHLESQRTFAAAHPACQAGAGS